MNAILKWQLLNHIKSENKDDELKKRIFDTYHKVLVNLFDESRKYYVIIAMLASLSKHFEKEKFSYKKLKSFHKRKEIIEIIDNIKSHYIENIEEKN